MVVTGQHDAPAALPLGDNPCTQQDRGLDGPHILSETFGDEISILRVLGSKSEWSRPVAVKLCPAETQGFTKGCQGFRETKMRTGGRVLLAVLNLCVRIKMRLAIFGTKHSDSDSRLAVSRCFNPETF
jgi:hypothetical protein